MTAKYHFKRKVFSLSLAAFLCFLLTGLQLTCAKNYRSYQESGMAALAQGAKTDPEDAVKATLLSDSTGIVAGAKFKLGVKFEIKPGWHTYYKEPGDSGMPPNFEWLLPTGFKSGPTIWPKPHKTIEAGLVAYGYENSVLHGSEITAPPDLKVGDKLTLKVKVKYLVCKDVCVPGKAELEITLPVIKSAEKSSDAPLFDALGAGFNDPVSTLSATPEGDHNQSTSSGKFSVLDEKLAVPPTEQLANIGNFLLPAFLGGLILNVMPCVLPVIAIKVLSILEQAKEEPARVKVLGLVFAAGIISSFMVLALGVIIVKAAGHLVGWGFQFQYPGFVAVMCAVILLMALSLFGMFYVNAPTSGEIDKLARQEGLAGTFFNGVLATILSTPCTAPFLGVAMGFAFSQQAWVIALIFFTSALGMASPYLLLTINPAWMKFLPKPGDWMDKFKQGMGFVMLFTVIWLDYVLATEVSADALGWVNAWLVGLAFCAWIVANFSDLTSSQTRRMKVFASAAGCLILFTYVCIFAQPGVLAALTPDASSSGTKKVAASEDGAYGIVWQPFSIDSLNSALAQKKTVFLDFTADWCLTCKVNEKTVIATKEVSEKLKSLNVVTIKADWTRQDPDITKLLSKFNRSGVPLYVIFPGAHPDKPIVLPEVITQDLVLKALEESSK
jgi:thiol:disulfide interchange protein DsbD